MLELPKASKNLRKERRKRPVARKDVGGKSQDFARQTAKKKRCVWSSGDVGPLLCLQLTRPAVLALFRDMIEASKRRKEKATGDADVPSAGRRTTQGASGGGDSAPANSGDVDLDE